MQEDRQRFLKETEEKGFITGSFGWRTSVKGTRFCIRDGILWDVNSPSGSRVGQVGGSTHFGDLDVSWAYLPGKACSCCAV